MTIGDVVEVAQRCQIKNPAIPGACLSIRVVGMLVEVVIAWRAPDRDTGERIFLTFGKKLSLVDVECMTTEQFILFVQNHVRAFFLHEFAECWHVDGKRVKDPHLGE